MLAFLKILALIIQYGPTIWAIVNEIIKLINGISEYMERQDAEEFKVSRRHELRRAVQYYKITRDKTRLNELHGELSVQLANFSGVQK